MTAAERKASSEKAKADVQARAAAFYETERKRNEESFQGVEAKSSFTVRLAGWHLPVGIEDV